VYLVLFTFIATGGYAFLHVCEYYKYVSYRSSARRIYLKSLGFGIFFFSITLILYALKLYLLDDLSLIESVNISYNELSNKDSKLIPLLSLITFFLSFIIAWSFNGILYLRHRTFTSIRNSKQNIDDEQSLKETQYELAQKRFSIDDFELLVIESIYREMPISVTLDTDKVYIGYIRNQPIVSQLRQYLKLLPLASGYRDESQVLHIEVDYSMLISNYDTQLKKNANADDDFEIVIKHDRIVSINLFNFDVYTKYHDSLIGNQSEGD